ncbi:MAG: hypothetical protein R2751_07495 [Bacteroidales bacterium]
MERQNHRLKRTGTHRLLLAGVLAGGLLLWGPSLQGGTPSQNGNAPFLDATHRARVYAAFTTDRMEGWDAVIRELRSKQATLSDRERLELVSFYYGYTAWAIGQGMDRKAEACIGEAEVLIDDLLEKDPHLPGLLAFKGAFIAFKVGLNKYKAVTLGPESMKYIDRAVAELPGDPQGWIERGNALFYMPRVFGGSKEKAVEAYRHAILLLEQDPAGLRHNWIYLNTLMTLGQALEKTGQSRQAGETYRKILDIEPGFTYVRDHLYPAFRKSQGD